MASTIEIKTTKVSDKGQVAIPVEFQKKMRLKKGDKIVLMLKDGSLVLQKSEAVSKKLERNLHTFRHFQSVHPSKSGITTRTQFGTTI